MQYSLAQTPEALIRGHAQVGAAEIAVCTDGTALFDGGAMFGVVPRTLWQRKMQPDALNRVAIGLNCVVVRLGGKTVLIETGFGNKLTQRLRGIYGTQELLPQSLKAAGLRPENVDLVINTHLHWDHCGWNTVIDATGEPVPFFPNAEYVAHRGEVEHGRRQLERDRISYVPDNYEPLLAAGQMRLVDVTAPGDREELCPGISVQCWPGHTRHMLAVHIESEGEQAIFVSDLVPTTAHLPTTWVMAFDLDPLRTIEERARFYQRAIEGGWLVIFPHDHERCVARLRRGADGKVEIAG